MSKKNELNFFDNEFTAQSNAIITSLTHMTSLSLKLFELAVSGLNRNDATNRDAYIDRQVVYEYMGLSAKQSNRSQRLFKALVALRDESKFCLPEDKEVGNENRIISPVSMISWSAKENTPVKITFTPEIMPYVTELKKKFTIYDLDCIRRFESKFSIILYKLVMMYRNQYEYYAKNGTKHGFDLENWHSPLVSVADLRRITDTTHSFTGSFSEFERGVLSKAVEEINEKTNLKVKYEKVKKRRAIAWIRFQIDSDAEVSVLKTDEQKRINAQEKAQAVMARESFALLLGSRLLNPLAVTDFELVAGLDEITNAYDEFLKTRDKSMLIRHLDYVRAHMLNEPKDLSTYLKTAFENWQKTLAKKPSRKAESENATDFDELARIQNEKAVAESGLSEEEYVKRELAEIEELKKRIRKPKEDR